MQQTVKLIHKAFSARGMQMRALPSLARFGTRQASVASSHISLPCRARQSGLIPQVGGGQWRWIRQVQSRALSVVSAAATAEQPQAEEITYQAEVDRMMDLIVNSLYSNKEVFLRELISNASDALDKARFLGLTDKDALIDDQALEIRIKADPDAGTITIEDTGIGMTRDELISSLGTIARSGTRKFAQMVKDQKDSANLIGQFGVGFYSAFLVAERVTVQSKSKDDSQWRWESAAGAHSYKVTAENGGDLKRGTRITLFLKEDSKELADDKKLAALIKQYSEFIQFPISLWNSQVKNEQVVDEEATQKKREEAIEAAKSKGEDETQVQVEDVKKSKSSTEWDWQIQNNLKPIWARSPKEVTKEEYDSFFKATFKEFMDPIAYNHFNVEGTLEFSSILFTPSMAPFEEVNLTSKLKNIRMYVKRVFISDEFDDNLMPRYLHFIKGVVDSSDLPLNISREILQESRVVRTIKKQLVKRSLEMLEDLAKRPAKPAEENAGDSTSDYTVFFDAFGKYLKLGVLDDEANRTRLAKLLRFPSSHKEEEMTSLEEYVSRCKPGQNDIYYLTAENKQVAQNSPFVERLVRKGYEVIFGVEAIDEPCLGTIGQFDGKLLVDVSREGLTIDDDEDKAKVEEAKKDLSGLVDFMKQALGNKVEKVEVTSRLTDSPCAITVSKHGWSAAQERIMKAQAMGDFRAAEYMRGKKSLEINFEHPMIRNLNANYQTDERNAKEIIQLMFETSLVTSGFDIESPKDFAARIYSMISLVTGDESGGSPSESSNGSGSGSREVVEPEVMERSSDPWRQ